MKSQRKIKENNNFLFSSFSTKIAMDFTLKLKIRLCVIIKRTVCPNHSRLRCTARLWCC